MRVLQMADTSFATRERSMLGRLEVGLTDEGVRVVRCEPRAATTSENAFSTRLPYNPDSGFLHFATAPGSFAAPGLYGVRSEARRLARAIADLNLPGRDRPIDLIHAWGEECWALAIETAYCTGAAVVFEVWSKRCLDLIRRCERRAAHQKESPPVLWLAPNQAICDAVHASGAKQPCRVSPWGVHVLGERKAWTALPRPISIVMLSAGRDTDAVVQALEGVAGATEQNQETLIFLDAAALRGQGRAWSAARRLGLLPRLSVIPDMEGRRDLVLRADMLILAETEIGSRSVVLDALAAGMTVVARPDRFAEELIDGRTPLLVGEPSHWTWAQVIRAALDNPAAAAKVGESARAFIKEERPASRHVESVLEAYRWTMSGEALPFEASVR